MGCDHHSGAGPSQRLRRPMVKMVSVRQAAVLLRVALASCGRSGCSLLGVGVWNLWGAKHGRKFYTNYVYIVNPLHVSASRCQAEPEPRTL